MSRQPRPPIVWSLAIFTAALWFTVGCLIAGFAGVCAGGASQHARVLAAAR